MTTLVVGVDPGSYTAGYSVWDVDLPEPEAFLACGPLRAADLTEAHPAPERLYWLFRELCTLVQQTVAIGAPVSEDRRVVLAVEHLVGRGVPPAPELDVFCRGLAQWADLNGYAYVEYTPRQWHDVARTDGRLPQDKEAIRWAMEARYPRLVALRERVGGMDAIEAFAIGLHHYSKERLAAGAGLVVQHAKER